MLSNREKIAIIESNILGEVLLIQQQMKLTPDQCAELSTRVTIDFCQQFGLMKTLQFDRTISDDVVAFANEFDVISKEMWKDIRHPYKEDMKKDR
jgi:hypothetical protein